ncbi:type II toxin-antitoxin system HipA family toxin [Nocardioides plantarum]|uniref:Type II toxin-antitoxin system HipA family toxin n=1 Tax=Nocardioides plantarum TaxID=29299 RepID=A0ABV5K8C6_9ACTN|nr:type II toxin-antitoxin system HipA family toxin [Nocardioides plantarum]
MSNRANVYVDVSGEPVLVGVATFGSAMRKRAGVSTTFTYDETWLQRPDSYAIDPALSLFGRSTTVAGLPGCFQDCSPDRWGRNLVTTRLRALALRDANKPRDLTDVDYLLGVADLTRQGALRLRFGTDGPFLDPEAAVPQLIELPRLLAAADAIERDPDDQAALKNLLDAGSGSLGGARPKASIRDGDQLMIAKFPHKDDDWDVMVWEATALDLAEAAGIDVPSRRLTHLNRRAVLILDRFDRSEHGARVPYVSAMTLLNRRDNDTSDYLDVCDAITDEGASPDADLESLWRRVALSVAIHNTDDHMRNHGFLRARGGWTMSPLFDVNPEPDLAKDRVTGIDGARSHDDELLGLESLAGECRLPTDRRNTIARQVADAVSTWPDVARSHGAQRPDIELFRPAFERGISTLLGLATP